VAESAEIIGREPARAAELVGGLVFRGHDCVPHFWTVLRSMVRKIRFSTTRSMTITVFVDRLTAMH
jgi:hypothetical protein